MSKMSFRWIVTLAMLAVGVVPVIALSLVFVTKAYNMSRSNALEGLQLMAEGGASRAEQEIRLLKTRLEFLAQDSDMEFAVRSLAFVERADRLVRDYRANNSLVNEIWYFNARKEVVASAPIAVEMLAPNKDMEFSSEELFGTNPSPRELSVFKKCHTRDNQLAMCFFQAVWGIHGDVVGVIAIQVKFSQVAAVVLSHFEPSIGVRLYSQEGKLVFAPERIQESEDLFLRFRAPVTLRRSLNEEKNLSPVLFVLELSDRIEERLKPVHSMVVQMVLYLLAVFVTIISVSIAVARYLLRPIQSMTRVVGAYRQGAFAAQTEQVEFFEFQEFMDTLNSLGERIQFYTQQVAEDACRESALKRVVAEVELQTLKNQMKPHFLFNALNNIVTLVGIDPEKAQQLLVKLSELYRLILAQTEKIVIPLADELSIVENFLALQLVRFEKRLSFEILCDVDRNHVFVPGLVLQTLVENALKHGIEPCREGGKIQVRICESEVGAVLPYQVEVTNTGQPLRSQERNNGKGLENTRRRLALIDGESHGLTLESTNAGTRVKFFFSGKQYD